MAGWLIGFGASLLADQVFFLSLTWAAIQLAGPGQVGLVLAAGSVPRLLILLVGGVFADRVSPKRIIIGTDTGRAVVMAAAATVLMFGSLGLWGLLVVALAIGALDGLFLPAVGALPARIAPAHLMGRVAALRTVTQRAAMLVGGPLAGWLLHVSGPAAAFGGSAVLFAVSVAALALVAIVPQSAVERSASQSGGRRQAATAATSPRRASIEPLHQGRPYDNASAARRSSRWWTSCVTGFRAVRRDPVLPWLLVLIAAMNFGFAGPVTVGIPLLSAGGHWGAQGAGLLLGGFGLGAAVSGLGLVFVRRISHAGWVALAGVSTMGAALAAVGVATTFPAAVVAVVVLGLASGVFGTVVHAMLLTSTPKAELGRVMGLVSLSIEGVVPVSFAATGVLAGVVGASATFVIGGAIILVATAAAFTRPRLRSFQLPPPEVPPPATLSDHTQPQTRARPSEQRRPETLTRTAG